MGRWKEDKVNLIVTIVTGAHEQLMCNDASNLDGSFDRKVIFVSRLNIVSERKCLWEKVYGLAFFHMDKWLIRGDFSSVYSFDQGQGGNAITINEVNDLKDLMDRHFHLL